MKSSLLTTTKLRKWVWLWYPLTVFIVILITFQFIVGGSGQAWVQLVHKQRNLVTDKEKLTAAQTKLAALRQLNQLTLAEDVRWTDQVMPSRKQIAVLVNQLRYAGSQSGSVLLSYQSVVGDIASNSASITNDLILHAEFLVPGVSEAQALLKMLEMTVPLLKVVQLGIADNQLSVDVMSAWQPLAVTLPEVTTPLPNYTTTLSTLRERVKGFSVPPLAVAITAPDVSSEAAELSSDPFTPLPSSN